ncbi:sugar/nucleoside kinase (ribokinase family) [Kineothrix alysoides]|uniref:Sugar/nucleoside kinase (Ribokinase family) n=1 Tax=Kineothrix alysoides TaxID=1469948 RepID=A0A4R1QXZ2_9FIRM|nr:sugar kinase [Kineothrix alysoides]TCL57314.1 sugar/nucleoside kinase (ribokinase family) [Kineothrix alysoides]
MKILCIGMMVCDTLLSPVPSNILELDSVSIHKPSVCCGGDALNVAIGLAKLDNSVSIIGRISDDTNGKFILDECKNHKIDVSGVIYDEECATAASYALIDEKGERHFLSEKSIFGRLQGKDIPDKAIEDADIIYIGSAMALRKMDEEGIYSIFSRAHEQGKITVMDAAINREDPDRDWLKYLAPAFMETDVFFPSIDEATKITGETDPEKIAEYFRPFSIKIFGIKLGASGCFVTDFKHKRYIKCPENMPVVDTTGAGDSFMAGLVSGLARGFDIFSSTQFAVSVATKNVGAMGGTAGIPNFQEAFLFYQKIYQ